MLCNNSRFCRNLSNFALHLTLACYFMPYPFTGPKIFWAGPNFLWQSQKFCARQKGDLHSMKLFIAPAQKFLKRHKMQSNFWAGSRNLDQHKTFWDL